MVTGAATKECHKEEAIVVVVYICAKVDMYISALNH